MAIEGRGHIKNELLLAAVMKGELIKVKRLLERSSADIHTKSTSHLSLLQLAIIYGHVKVADYLIQKGIDLHYRDPQGWTALHDAALGDHKPLVRKLILKGCSPTATTNRSELPIDVAGSIQMEKFLCEEMASGGEKQLARQYFIYFGLEYLSDSDRVLAKAQPASSHRYYSCLSTKSTRSSGYPHPNQRSQTRPSGSNFCLKPTRRSPKFQGAIIDRPRSYECRHRWTTASGINDFPWHSYSNQFIKREDVDGATPLSHSEACCDSSASESNGTSHSESTSISETLVDSSADSPEAPRRKVSFAEPPMANTKSKKRETPGGSTVDLSEQVIAQLNKIYEGSYSKSNSDGSSDGSYDPEEAIAKLKMKPRKSSIVSPDRRRSTEGQPRRKSVSFQPEVLLQEMVTDGDAKVVSEMLESGAIPDINKMSPAGLTALHQSAIDGNVECARTLIKNGAKVNCMDCEGWTPLHASAMTNNAELCKFLLESGANAKMKNDDGQTAYDITKNGPIRKMLLCAMNGKNPDADDFSDGEYSGEEEAEYSHAESDSEEDEDNSGGLFNSVHEKKPSLKERLGLNHSVALKNVRDNSVSPSPDLDPLDSVFTSRNKNPNVCPTSAKRDRGLTDSTSSCGSQFEPELERIGELDENERRVLSTTALPTAAEEVNCSDTEKVSEDQGISTMEGSSDCSHRSRTYSDDEGTSRDVLDSELETGSLNYKFQEAVLDSNMDSLLKLVKHKSEIDVSRVNKSSGITALHHSVLEENFALVQHLVNDFDADVHVKDTDGWTPLHAASAVGNIRIAQFLLERGAKASALNNSCEFPVDVAEDEAMEKLLKNAMLGPLAGKLLTGMFS